MSFWRLTVIVGIATTLTSCPPVAMAIDAWRYVITPSDAANIDVERDHYSVAFIQGWISDKDNFFKAVFSNKKNGLIQITTVNRFFEGEPVVSENTASFLDLRSNTNRPIGQAIQLLDQVPGDADTRVTIKIALHSEDTIATVIQSLEDSRAALPADIFAGAWIGYSRAVSGVLTRLFGTNSGSYPFYWIGDIRISDVLNSRGIMKEHYIVLISPQRDNDRSFATLDGRKLTYDQITRRVLYDGNPLSDWSYVVLRVAKGRAVSVDRELYQSIAPWAVLGRSQFISVSVSDGNLDQIRASANGLVGQLKNQLDLLVGERKFSKRDRGLAIHTFTTRAIEAIRSACSRAQIPNAQCPTSQLEQFRTATGKSFEFDERTNREIALESLKVNSAITAISASLPFKGMAQTPLQVPLEASNPPESIPQQFQRPRTPGL
jgi:hypothetical protein